MSNKCSNPNCHAPDVTCIEGHDDYHECPNWSKTNIVEDENTDVTIKEPVEPDASRAVSWTGNSFGLEDLNIIAERSNPYLIGIIGASNAGKTSFLCMLYTLLYNGKNIENYQFAGSYTLISWENIANNFRFNGNSSPTFPPHTTSQAGRINGLLHLSLKNNNDFKDVIFTDAPGEWFSKWAEDVDNSSSMGARWIHQYANVFLLFIDCQKLTIESKNRGKERAEVIRIIKRLNQNLGNRPVAVIWSKYEDYEVSDQIEKKIKRALKDIPNYKEFEVNNIPNANDDTYCIDNIREVIKWALNHGNSFEYTTIDISAQNVNSFLLKYRGL